MSNVTIDPTTGLSVPAPSFQSSPGSSQQQGSGLGGLGGNGVPPPVPNPPTGAAGTATVDGSVAAAAAIPEDARKAAFIADQMAKKEEKVKRRQAVSRLLWPTTARLDEFLDQSGREKNVEPHVHVATLLNMPEWAEMWTKFQALPGAHQSSSTQLRRCREAAIRLMMTKDKKKENREKREKEQKRKSEEKDKKGKKGSGSSKDTGNKNNSSNRVTTRGRAGSSQTPATATSTSSSVSTVSSTNKRGRSVGSNSSGPIPKSPRPHADNNQQQQHQPRQQQRQQNQQPQVPAGGDGEDVAMEHDSAVADVNSVNTEGAANNDKPPGEWRIVVEVGDEGQNVELTKKMWETFQTRFAAAIGEQHDDLEQQPILIKEHWYYGNRITIEPANQYSQGLICDIVANKIVVQGNKFRPILSKDLPATATIVFRIEVAGVVKDLIMCPKRGVARLNGWGPEARKGLRVLKSDRDTATTGVRFVRVAATAEAVNHIKQQGGVVYVGSGQASVQWKKQPLKVGVEVTFTQQ